YPQDEWARTQMDTSAELPAGYFGQASAEESPLGLRRNELERAAVSRRGLAVTPKAPEQVGARRRQQVVVRQRPGPLEFVNQRQRGRPPGRRARGHRLV